MNWQRERDGARQSSQRRTERYGATAFAQRHNELKNQLIIKLGSYVTQTSVGRGKRGDESGEGRRGSPVHLRHFSCQKFVTICCSQCCFQPLAKDLLHSLCNKMRQQFSSAQPDAVKRIQNVTAWQLQRVCTAGPHCALPRPQARLNREAHKARIVRINVLPSSKQFIAIALGILNSKCCTRSVCGLGISEEQLSQVN